MGFGWLDYLILALYFAGITAFGAWLGRKQKSTRDYFLAGGAAPWWAVSVSIVATETSTLTFIGAPALAYDSNLTFLQLVFGYVIGRIIVSLLLIPAYFKGALDTSYQLLNQRFGGRVKNFAALLFLTTRSLADGVRLFATGLVLHVILRSSGGWPGAALAGGDILPIAVMGLLTIYYTFKGGMRAVIWTDFIQMIVYVSGALLAFWILLERMPGGWQEIMAAARAADKLRLFDFSFNPGANYTFWSGVIGGALLTTATHGTDQLMVQRYLACGSRWKSQVALITSGLVVLAQFALFLVIGVMLYVFYGLFSPARTISKSDEVFPVFIVEQMPSVAAGLVIAAIFAAAMSTLSGSLNSLASVSVNDFYRVYFKPQASEEHYLKVSRTLTVVWGIVLIGIGVLAREWGSVLEVGLTIASFTLGSVLGVFLLAVLSSKTDESSALAAMASSLLFMLGIQLLGRYNVVKIAWTWYVPIGTLAAVFVGLIFQQLRPQSAAGAAMGRADG